MKLLHDYIPEPKWVLWRTLTRKERALQIMAYLADVLEVEETNGSNRGEVLDSITRYAGYNPADRHPYCAITITACCLLAGYRTNELPVSPAAVHHWWAWASGKRHLTNSPRRGDLAYWLNPNGTGHIGFWVRKKLTLLGIRTETIEANTSPGEDGSQREGDGIFRRLRKTSVWHGFIRLPE